jgi:hypothetical protein
MTRFTAACQVVSTCILFILCGCQTTPPALSPFKAPSQSPLKVRGGSVKAIYYGDTGSSWNTSTVVPGNSASVTLTNISANTIHLDGVDPKDAGATNTPGEDSQTPNANWRITITFRDKNDPTGKAEDPNSKLVLCTLVDDKNKCKIDQSTATPPGNTVYFQGDANGQLVYFDNTKTDMPHMDYNLTNCGGSMCTDAALQNHIHSVKIEWINQSPIKYHCPDGLCVIAVGPQ